MDWQTATEEERQTLKRIVALLLSLAALANRAAGRSSPTRLLVLWLLRPAEAVARRYVLDLARETRVPTLPMAMSNGDSPADAARLARCFRILGFILDTLAALAVANARMSNPQVRQDRRSLHPAAIQTGSALSGHRVLPYADTS